MRRALWALAAAFVFVAACGKDDNKDEQELTVPPEEQPQPQQQQTVPVLSINEVTPSTAGCLDDAGQAADTIELYNRSDSDLSLNGFALTDDEADLTKALLDSSLVVPGRGVLVLWADGQTELGPQHLPIKLNGPNRLLLLTGLPEDDVGGKVVGERRFVLDRVDLTDFDGTQSLARFPDGEGSFMTCGDASCDGRNGSSCGLSPGPDQADPFTRRR
jgi:hypothetical protein